MVAKSDPYTGARVQSPDGGTDWVIASGGSLVLETGAKLFSGETDVTGNLSGGSSGTTSIRVPITQADLLVLGDAPIELIPAPGTNKMIWVDAYVHLYLAGSIGYAGDSSPVVAYGSGVILARSTDNLDYSNPDLDSIFQGSSAIVFGVDSNAASALINQPVVLKGSNLTLGNGSGLVVGEYHIIDVS